MGKIQILQAKIIALVNEIKAHWSVPAKRKYVPYKEIVAYSVGGIGVQFIASMIGLIALNAGSFLVGASIGIDVMGMQTITAISTVIGIITAPTRAMIFDNTRSRMGKFRPYLLYMGLPSALLYMLFVYMPYENMDSTEKFITVLVIYNLIQFCSPFYTTAYSSLVQVMSPDTKERAWIIEISSFVYSLAPTITGPVMPLIGPLDNINTYRIAAPIFCLIGFAMSMLCVFGTKEKVIVPKRYIPKVGFFEGMKKVCKNKYFWIIYGSQWLGFMSNGYGFLFQWIFYYGMNNPAIYSLMTLIRGEASTPGMLLGAPLINKFGKKKICLISMLGQIVCILAMLLCYQNYVLIFIMMFIKDIFGAVSIVYTPAMKADVVDYQQYKTGDRLEGFIEQIGVFIGSILGLGTGYIIPYIIESMGLENNFSDLYSADFRNPIVKVIIICSAIGTIMSTIPYFFYNLSESKRSNMIKVLKIRAMFADYYHGDISNEQLVDTMEEINETLALIKENYNESEAGEEEKAARIVYDELHKFERDDMKEKLRQAKAVVNEYSGIEEPDAEDVRRAMLMPDGTRQERKIRNKAIKEAERRMLHFEKAQSKYVAAKRLIEEYESFSKWNEIQVIYAGLSEKV